MLVKRILLSLVLFSSSQWPAIAAPLGFGAGSEWFRIQQTAPAYQNVRAVFGDVNGDGKADLILYAYRIGVVSVALSTGGAFSAPKVFAENMPIDPTGLFALSAVDVNGDGKADLVFMNHGADNVAGAATAQVALSTGSAFGAATVWNTSWCANYQTCFVADINADKRADLVAFTPNFGIVYGSTAQGNSFSNNTVWNKFFCIKNETCAVGDVDGDGRADVIAFKSHATGVQKGNVLWAKSNGTVFTDIQTGHGYFCVDAEQCYVGDVNGDGKTDIIAMRGYGGFGKTLDVLVSLSDGTHFINAKPFIWAQVPYLNANFYEDFAFVDVNGDKKADMVQFGTIPRPPNTSFPAYFVAKVYLSGDQNAPAPGTGATPANPPASFGWSSVQAYNCAVNEERIYLWTIDLATGERNSTGPVDALYTENQSCPDGRDPPTTLSLTAGHSYRIVAVLPGATGCEGRNDPDIVGCAYLTLFVDAKAAGPACHFYIGGQAATCNLIATTLSLRGATRDAGTAAGSIGRPPTAEQFLAALKQANVDFSRPQAINELKGWLGDATDTPYPAIAAALLGLVGPKHFAAPVYIDVIAFDYEPNQNAVRPRSLDDVDVARLKQAVLAASNERNGAHETDFAKLLVP